MRLSVTTGIGISALTGARLGRFTVFAESKSIFYSSTYQEGSAILTFVCPTDGGAAIERRSSRLHELMLSYQDGLDKVFLAPDYGLFKEGKKAPIAAGLYWRVRLAIEAKDFK
jgi:hypothetical protein